LTPSCTRSGDSAPVGLVPSIIAADPFGVVVNLRNAWQMMNSQWESWVVGYNMDKQRQFFSNLGFEVDWRTLGFYLLLATALVGGAVSIGLLVRDRPPRRDASLVAWDRFCAKLGAAGLPRQPHEGPLDYARRIAAARPAVGPAAEDISGRYIEARYGKGATRDELRDLARRVRQFRAA
jgi:protein-glutamine gamma-glutamyltransferase